MEHLRTQKPTLDIDDMELTCTDCPEKHFADDQLVTQVRTAVESLPVNQCQVMTLVDLGAMAAARSEGRRTAKTQRR